MDYIPEVGSVRVTSKILQSIMCHIHNTTSGIRGKDYIHIQFPSVRLPLNHIYRGYKNLRIAV